MRRLSARANFRGAARVVVHFPFDGIRNESRPMADYIEGKRPIIEALRTNVPVKRVLLADNVKRDPLIEDILRKA